jgi:WG containing repeat
MKPTQLLTTLWGLVLLLLSTQNISAQNIKIPDSTFAQAVRRQCLDCLSLDNTLLPKAAKLTRLDVSFSNIRSLEGIAHFKNLDTLNCSGNPLHRLPDSLPLGLKHLICANDSLDSLPSLPVLLLTFDCSLNQLDSLPNLPLGLQKLNCNGNRLKILPTLWDNLVHINCNYNKLKNIGVLPDSLRELRCEGNQMKQLPQLPMTLTRLDCGINNLDELPALPYRMQHLSARYNYLPTFPGLPDSLLFLDCSHNGISELPPITDLLLSLNCGYNSLINIPRLPKSLRVFDCRNNLLLRLPKLPYNLEKLYCKENDMLECFINQPDLMQADTVLPICQRRIFDKITIQEDKVVTDREVNLVPYRKGNKWGYANFEGSVVIPPQFEAVKFFTSRNECQAPFAIVTMAGKKGILDDIGEYVVEPSFDQIECNNFYGYVARQADSKHWFFVTSDGLLIEDTLDRIVIKGELTAKSFPARMRDNTYRNSVNPLIVNYSGKASFSLRRKVPNTTPEAWTFTDTIPPVEFDSLVFTEPFSDSLFARKDGKWGMIDFNQQRVLPFEYDTFQQHIYRYTERDTSKKLQTTTFYVTKQDKGWGVVNNRNLTVIPSNFDSVQTVYLPDNVFLLKNGELPKMFFKVSQAGKWGVINPNADWTIETQFDDIQPDDKTGFILKKGNRFGYYILQNSKIVPPQYKAVRGFIKGLVQVLTEKNQLGYVDENGNEYFKDEAKSATRD